MDVLKSLKQCMRVTGFREEGTFRRLPVSFYLVTLIIMLINMTCFVSERWYDLDDRINGLKTAVFLSTYIGYVLSFIIYWRHFLPAIHCFYNLNFQVPFTTSSKRKGLLDLLRKRMTRFDKYWRTMTTAYIFPIVSFPGLILFVRVVIFSEELGEVIKESQCSPFPFYYPEYTRHPQRVELQVFVLVVAYILQFSSAILIGYHGHLAHVTVLCTMINVEFELKLLRLSFVEMKQLVRAKADNKKQSDEVALKTFHTYFLQHHQHIYRRFEVVEKGTRWITAILSSTASMYMCMSIYTIVQKDQAALKLQEAVFFALWAYAIYLIDSCGENIKTQDEKLRDAFYECDWWEMPQWFKRSVLVSLTRATKPTDMKPFRLFSLNLSSFAMTMNAAYSYYNLLHNFNRK